MSKEKSDNELIEETIDNYFKGMYHGDVERLKKAFHPEAHVIGHFDRNFIFNSLDQFLDFVKSSPVPAEKGEEYDMRIVLTDITGDVGCVKVEDLYQGRRFTDYLTVLKHENNWVIINKGYRHEPKS
ncbi:MAG: nuclear transport factor 2 family protein [Candidatus Thorarchaeota archaeon]